MFRIVKIVIAVLLVVACNASAPGAAPPQAPSSSAGAQAAATPPDIPGNERSTLAEIRLDKVGEACQVVAATRTTRARFSQAVVWIVRNRCKSEQTVDLVNIVEKATGQPVYPFEPGPRPGCTAQAGGSCAIVLVVLPNDPNHRAAESLNKIYTYDFGRKGGDPELVIEWP
jgi:hypothetical protein